MASSWISGWRRTPSAQCWRRCATRTSTRVPEFAGRLTTTEVLCRHIWDALAAAAREGRLGDGGRLRRIRVTLHESHVARGWYEADLR